MRKIVKIVARMLRLPKELPDKDIKFVVKHFAGPPKKSRSKHLVYDVNESHQISLPKSGPIKQYLIKRIIEIFKLEEWYEKHKKKQ